MARSLRRGGPAYRDERRVFGGTGLFLVPWTVLYAATSEDHAGAVLLGGCSVALLALALYFHALSRRVGERPSDAGDAPSPPAARIDAAAGHAAALHNPEMSVWPLVLAAGATLLGFGLAFTAWVAIPAGLLLAIGVWGYAREA